MHITAVTPDDYEPPGFQATSDEDFAFKEETTNIKVGDVLTVSVSHCYQNLVVYSLSLSPSSPPPPPLPNHIHTRTL